ncbi:MAG: citramalate synthase [Planctomycetes bacterium]|nr:citramalate synthase [Planctomycetota bacterium]
MPRIWMYDTTLRDGSQGEGVSFSLEDKLLITRKLDELGIDYVEGGYPLSNPKDAEYFRQVRELPLQHARVVAFGMTRRRGFRPESDSGMQALVTSEAPVLAIVGKSWDLHVREVLQVSLEENLAMIADSVVFAKAAGREVVYDAEHFFDGFRANPDYALQTIRAAEEAGADWIVLCDTNGGSLPETVAQIVTAAREAVAVALGIHCHNDGDLAVANTLAAVDRGATQVHGTINGVGERCGNVDLISVIANLALKKQGYEVAAARHLRLLTPISRFVYETANMNFRNNQPFVGTSAFAHKGGMHVHAVARNAAAYEHIDPALVGNQRRILISELSGRSNIVAKTVRHRVQGDQALMRRILERVQDLENEGYQFEAAEASFDILVKKLAGSYRPFFERLGYRVNVETDGQAQTVNEATVKLRIGDRLEHTVSEGDGPVNALDAALRKALEPSYPRLREMQLVDYRVRVINSRSGTAARVRVVIESCDQTDVWGTVAVSENIIEASWLALADSFEYKLFKDLEGPEGRLPAQLAYGAENVQSRLIGKA